ncbi:MAG TPA: hypothetical protein VIY48_19790 [Candidatus Paceibacterota bacterium]
MAETKAFDAALLETMTKNYNARLTRTWQKCQRTDKGDEPPKLTKDEIEKMAIQCIEKKVNLNGGATIMEIAALLAIRFGTTGSSFPGIDQTFPKQGLKPKEIEQVAINKETEWVKGKEAWEAKRKAEVAMFRVPVETYLQQTYGDPLKNPMGQLLGYGDRLVYEKGHFRTAY